MTPGTANALSIRATPHRYSRSSHDGFELEAASGEQLLQTVFETFARYSIKPHNIDIQLALPGSVSWHRCPGFRHTKFSRLESLHMNSCFTGPDIDRKLNREEAAEARRWLIKRISHSLA